MELLYTLTSQPHENVSYVEVRAYPEGKIVWQKPLCGAHRTIQSRVERQFPTARFVTTFPLPRV